MSDGLLIVDNIDIFDCIITASGWTQLSEPKILSNCIEKASQSIYIFSRFLLNTARLNSHVSLNELITPED
ncbi:hypothetical protein [Endozoicomonas numazuensis]|uniref:hypothetical protein n=1 Tax=Endozoicomonas numazuensis TaxID=1137799 RepID=UPI001267BB34|nr:hypothetical protein [Endozoicomonas numazuensis]